MVMENMNSAFVNPNFANRIVGQLASAAGSAATGELVNQLRTGEGIDASAIVGAAVEGLGAEAGVAAQAVVDTIIGVTGINNESITGTPDIIIPGGNDGDGNFRSPGGSMGHQRLSYDPNPVEVRLTTGIVPNCVADYYHDSVANEFVSLHLVTGKLNFPDSSDSPLNKYWSNIITLVFTNNVQAAVSFAVDYSALSTGTLVAAMNALLDAVQTFLFFDSILTVTNSGLNRNEGMAKLRAQLTATDLNNLNNLRTTIKVMPIPPNLLQMAYYLMQTYSSSATPGSSLLKICPVPLKTVGFDWMPDTSYIETAASNLTAYRSTYALLARACPKWLSDKVMSSNEVPLHDPNFTTIWANLPLIYSKGSGSTLKDYKYPACTSTSRSAVPYSSFSNELDGAAYSLTSFYNSTISQWEPSLFKPITSTKSGLTSNRWSFIDNGATKDFQSASLYESVATNRAHTYFVLNDGIYSMVPFGAENIKQVNPDAVLQTAYMTTEWLLSLDTIGTLEDRRVYGKSKTGNYNGNNKQKQKRQYKGKK